MDKKRLFSKSIIGTVSVAIILATVFLSASCNKALHTSLINLEQKKSILTRQISISKFSKNNQFSETDTSGFPLEKMPDYLKERLIIPHVYTNIPLESIHLPDMPLNTSEQTKQELNYLEEIQKNRSTGQLIRAWYLAYFRFNPKLDSTSKEYNEQKKYLFYVGASLGDWYRSENLPKTTLLLSNVWKDYTAYVWLLKSKYDRTRPYLLDKKIHNRQTTNWPAYPSGHASFAYMCAYLMSEILPDSKTVLVDDAFEIAFSREILGVHFPSDSEAGRQLAEFYVKELFKSAEFRKNFEAAKEEIAQYHPKK